MNRASPGFTLVEILIAMTVFGFVLVGIAQGVDFGLRAWDAQARMVSQRADLDAVDRVLRGLIERMDPGSVADPPRVVGSGSRLAFTTDMPAAATGPLQRHVDLALQVDAGHRLLARWTSHTHSTGAGSSSAGGPPPSGTTLLTGVAAIRFGYLRPATAGGAWTETWSESYLPRLVRIHLEFAESDPRRWPDIVAEPAEDRPRE